MKRQASIKPSNSQAETIRYFATGEQTGVRVNGATYRICRERGWIEPIDAFPFHRVTTLGRAAIDLPVHGERHGTCGTCGGGVHEYPAGWAHTVRPLNCTELVPTKVH